MNIKARRDSEKGKPSSNVVNNCNSFPKHNSIFVQTAPLLSDQTNNQDTLFGTRHLGRLV